MLKIIQLELPMFGFKLRYFCSFFHSLWPGRVKNAKTTHLCFQNDARLVQSLTLREESGPDSLCKAHCTASKGMACSQGTFDPWEHLDQNTTSISLCQSYFRGLFMNRILPRINQCEHPEIKGVSPTVISIMCGYNAGSAITLQTL